MNIETIDQSCKQAGVPLSNEQRCVIIGVLRSERLVEEFRKTFLKMQEEGYDFTIGTKPKQDDGWIEWKGGECPVAPDTEVMVRLRGESEEGRAVKARCMHWTHTDPCVIPIISYKVIG